MHKIAVLLSFPLASKSQQVSQDLVEKNRLKDLISVNLRQGAVKILSTVLEPSVVDSLTSHGCWCSRLDHTKDDPFKETGGQPIDGLDSICKNWFTSRTCLKLDNGSCKLPSVERFYSVGNCANIGETCLADVCKVDMFYVALINEHLETEQSFTTEAVCTSASKKAPKYRWCQGTAPHLQIKTSEDSEHYGHGLANSKIHQVCHDKFMNLLFVVDGSDDTNHDDFINMKNFMISLFFELDIERNYTQVSLIQYGGNAELVSKNEDIAELQTELVVASMQGMSFMKDQRQTNLNLCPAILLAAVFFDTLSS